MNRWMKQIKKEAKKGIALLLTVILVLAVLPWESLLTRAGNTGGFELSLNWNNYTADDGDNSIYRYDSATAETRTMRLNVKYSNKEMTESYEKGTVVITVPGLNGAGRDADITASSVAADKASSTKKEYAWSYSYNASTDLYTFTNNNTLEKGKNFSGSFEILFTIDSRTSLDDYSKDLTANLYTTNNVELESNTLTYKQERTKDIYSLEFSIYNRAYQGEGLDSSITDPDDYWWVNYEAISTRTEKAWGLEDSYYEILLPQGSELRYVEGGWRNRTSTTRSFEKTGTEEIGTETYDVWQVDAVIYSDAYTTYDLNYLVIYPKAEYGDSATIITYTRLIGTYEGEDKAIQLDEQTTQVAVSEYPYPTYNGSTILASKTGIGIGQGTDFARQYGTDTYNYGYVDSRHIRNGAGEYSFSLYGELRYDGLRNRGYLTYDLEITEEQVEVMMEEDGGFRELDDDEYTITSMTIPANSNIVNQSGNPIDPCEVIINVRTRGESEYKEYGTYTVGSSSQKISFSEEEEIVGAQISFMELTEGIKVTVPVTMIFHSDDDGIATNGGTLVNTVSLNAWLYESSATGTSEAVSAENEDEMETEKEVSEEDDEEGKIAARDEAEEQSGDDGTPDEPEAAEETEDSDSEQPESQTGTDSNTAEAANGSLVQGVSEEGKILLMTDPYTWPAELLILERPNFYYNTTTLGEFSEEYSQEQGGLTSNVNLRTTFSYMEDEELNSFSMYTILPEDMVLDNSIRSRQDLYESITLTNTLGLTESELEKALDVVTLDTDYKNSGRTMIRLQFTFDKAVVEPSGYISASFPIVAGGYDVFQYGIDATVRGISVVEDDHLVVSPSYGIAANNGSYASEEQELWNGLAADMDTSKTISYSQSRQTVTGIAITVQNDISKRVATVTEGNVYTIPTKSGGSYEEDTVPLAEQGTKYSYKLQTTPLTDDGTYATELILVDTLESGALSEWQGTFQGVDASAAELALSIENETDVEATIWYSDKDLSSEMEQVSYKPDLDDTSVWTKEGEWQKEMGDVKSIAISFGDVRVQNYQQLEVIIHMTAPDDDSYVGRYTENAAGVYYEVVSNSGTTQGREWISSMEVAVKLTKKLVTLTIEKVDEEDGTVLSGAEFDLYQQLGNTPAPESDTLIRSGLTTNAKGQTVIQKFEEGDYYLVETAAPAGYELEEDPIILAVYDEDADGTVQIQIQNSRKTGAVTLQKNGVLEDLDYYDGAALSGAEFDLYQQLGSEPDLAGDTQIRTGLKTDAEGKITVEDLKWGTYYFVETVAPAGYEDPDENMYYVFTISAGSGTEEKVTITAENEQIPSAVQLIKYERLENGKETEDPAEGAIYTLYMDDGSTDGIELQTVRTDAEGKTDVITGLPFGKYFFLEAVTPNGYYPYGEGEGDEPSGRISFELTEAYTNDNPLVVETYDQRKYGNLWIQKTDDAGNYVAGAEYTLYQLDEHGDYDEDHPYEAETGYENPAETDAEGAITFDRLTWGTYILKETKAPQGYELDETEYEIEIGPDTVSSIYVLQVGDNRKTGSVQIIKITEGGDADDPDDRLEGAMFSLYRNDGTLVSEGHTTNSDGEVLIEDLEWGSYYLEETEAPADHSLTSEKVRFSINAQNADVLLEMEVENPMQRSQLSLTKRIYLDDWVESHGNPTFIFKIENTAGDAWYKTIVFDEDMRTNGNTGTDSSGDYVELTTILADLDAGTYTVTEENVIRYELGEITASPTGSYTIDKSNNSVEITIDEDTEGEVTFTNKKTVQNGGSDTSLINNMVTAGKKLTAISAEYSGGTYSTDDTALSRSDLVVTAYYDDGTSRTLGNNEYDLWDADTGTLLTNDEFPDSWGSGAYTIRVTYEEDGIAKKDTFVIQIEGTLPFRWTVNETEGTATIIQYTGDQQVVSFPRQVSGIWSGATLISDGNSYTVTSIEGSSSAAGYSVLRNKYDSVTSIILPDTLTSIGDYAFSRCTALTGSLTIPDSVESIGKYSFYYCSGSDSLILETTESRLVSIGEYAFSGCSGFKGDLLIPDSVKSIEYQAFSSCSGFDGTLIFGSDDGSNSVLASIGEYAFGACSGFKGDLLIPDSVTSIEFRAFYSCSGFDGTLTFGSGDGGNIALESIGSRAFYYCEGFTGELLIPDSVENIGDSAFYYCSGFDGTLIFGSGDSSNSALESIGSRAFYYCEGFTGDLLIPDSVKSIEYEAFYYCSGFDGTLTFGSGDGSNSALESIEYQAFYGCEGFTGDLLIPGSVQSIEYGAFYYCSGFDGTLTFGSGDGSNSVLENIGNDAFRRCSGFKGDLFIPDSVENIGNFAFGACSGFDGTLIFGSGDGINSALESIGVQAFYSDRNFSGDTYVPKSVTHIDTGAFSSFGSSGGATVYFPAVWDDGVSGYPFGAVNSATY